MSTEIDPSQAGASEKLRRLAHKTTARVSCDAIKYFIDSHLHDPCLGPQQAAQSLHISQRYLHKIFAESGTSFCRYVRHQRLEHIHGKNSPIPAPPLAPSAILPWNWAFTITPIFRAPSAKLTA